MRVRAASIFVVAVLALPLLYVPGIGNWVREPKIIVFMIATAIAMIATALRGRARAERPGAGTRTVVVLATMVLALQVASVSGVTNPGTFLIAIGLTVSAIGAGWVVHRTEVSVATIATVSTVIAVVLAACAICEVYLGVSWFGRELFVGLPVGGRNYLPTVLAVTLPVVEVRLLRSLEASRARRIAAGIALLAIVVAAIVFRTRAVWLMLALQAIVLGAMAVRHRSERRFRVLAVTHVLVVAVAVGVVALVPTRLQWSASSHPYLDSLASPSTSGRTAIWRVVASEIAEHPIGGIGAGQYPVLARTLVERHADNPAVFAFSTTDSPAFNDYLQVACEIGVLGGVIFSLVYLGMPLALLLELLRRRVGEPERLPLCLSLVSIAIGAAFTNSVDRPEQLAIFAVYAAVALRTRPPGDRAVARTRLANSVVALATILPLVIGGALLVRFVAFPTPAGRRLGPTFDPSLAYAVWPWDKYWNVAGAYLAAGPDRSLRDEHARARLGYWPEDPDALLVVAHADEAANDLPRALDDYRRAVFEVRGGRCRITHFPQLEGFLRRHRLAPGARDRAIHAACDVPSSWP